VEALTDGVVVERARRRDEGFTLIELLIVIVILGILSVVVVVSVGGLTDQGQTSACDIDERAVRTAVEAYAAQNNGAYPTTGGEAELVTAGFLTEESTLHQYSPTASGNQPYTVTGEGDCA
jgi:prepilin-type N-terminal cleavage/methylation domain-containing protein